MRSAMGGSPGKAAIVLSRFPFSPQGHLHTPRTLLARRQLLRVLVALPSLAGLRALAAASAVPAAIGYLPWWIAAGWKDLALSRLGRVVLFDAPVGQDGSVQTREWPAGIAPPALEVALTLFEHTHFDELFTHAERRARLLAQATE